MREIKFRYWDETKMLYGIEDQERPLTYWYQDRLMQFTGLLDKNGKEIYEGDIVINIPAEEPREVEYRDYCFCLKGVENSVWLGATHEFVEVIGNIYENPDLLK